MQSAEIPRYPPILQKKLPSMAVPNKHEWYSYPLDVSGWVINPVLQSGMNRRKEQAHASYLPFQEFAAIPVPSFFLWSFLTYENLHVLKGLEE